jgi:hypothetical protein
MNGDPNTQFNKASLTMTGAKSLTFNLSPQAYYRLGISKFAGMIMKSVYAEAARLLGGAALRAALWVAASKDAAAASKSD